MSKQLKDLSSAKPINAYRVVMPTKRVAYIRELKISDNMLAAKSVGKKSGNNIETMLSMQNELLKLVLVKIDDQALDHRDKNDLDALLNLAEYKCLLKVLDKIGGEEESGEEAEMEMTSI